MTRYTFVSFFLGHGSGERTKALLRDCKLLDVLRDARNRHFSDLVPGVYVRLPEGDSRLAALIERLRADGIDPTVRVELEFSTEELNRAEFLQARVATAGLYGGADFSQIYDASAACPTCGAGSEASLPLIVELRMGKREIDHVVFENYWIVSRRLGKALLGGGLSGFELAAVRPRRGSVSRKYVWLKPTSMMPPLRAGFVVNEPCPRCPRSGVYAKEGEILRFAAPKRPLSDVNRTIEYAGMWGRSRGLAQTTAIAGGYTHVLSQQARQLFAKHKVGRMVWEPVEV